MDLNVKLYGLKYNIRKVQGCFCKNPWSRLISRIYELIFYCKSGARGPWTHGLRSQRLVHESIKLH
jgi:hypothetical protein